MKDVKNHIYKLAIFLFLLLPSIVSAQAQEESISKFNTTVEIDKSGKIYVKEEITYDFGNQRRHGISRTIPYKKTNDFDETFVIDIEDVKIQNDAGLPHKFTKSKDIFAGEITYKIGSPDNKVTGKVFYEISYTVSGALTYFKHHDELNWDFTGFYWEVPILSSYNVVILPDNVSTSETDYICYTGKFGDNSKDCQITPTDQGYIISTKSILGPYEGISGAVKFPKDRVAVLEPKPDKSWIVGAVIGAAATLVGLYWYVYFPIKTLKKRLKNKRFLDENKKVVAAWFEPPKDDKFNEFTPAETGVLIDKTPDKKEVTATIIDLAQRGYLKIKKDNKDFIFMRTKEYENDRFVKSYEKLILAGLFEKKDVVSTKDLQKSKSFGKNMEKFMNKVVEELENKGLFESDLSKEKTQYITRNVLAAATFNIFYLAVSYLFRHHYIKFNKKGVEKYSETISLKNFLVSQDEKFDFQADKMMFFEKLLPYATAFGVEDVWAERFKDFQFTDTDWYEGDIRNVSTFTNMSTSLNSSVSSSMTYYSGGRSSSGFSSGFSSGGGFAGSGGGGGGGGSW